MALTQGLEYSCLTHCTTSHNQLFTDLSHEMKKKRHDGQSNSDKARHDPHRHEHRHDYLRRCMTDRDGITLRSRDEGVQAEKNARKKRNMPAREENLRRQQGTPKSETRYDHLPCEQKSCLEEKPYEICFLAIEGLHLSEIYDSKESIEQSILQCGEKWTEGIHFSDSASIAVEGYLTQHKVA